MALENWIYIGIEVAVSLILLSDVCFVRNALIAIIP